MSFPLAEFILWLYFPPGKDSVPIIVSSPVNTTVVAGGDVTLSCNATGLPAPLIRWYDSRGLVLSHPTQVLHPKPQRPPPAGPEPSCLSVPRVGWGSLRLSNVTPERAGEFRCEAINEHGSALSTAFLTVGKLKPQSALLAPWFR